MNIKQALMLPTTGHVFMVAFLLGMGAALLAGMDRSLAVAEDAQRRQLAAVLFFQANASDPETQKLANALPSQDSSIVSVQYLSKQSALDNAQRDPAFSRSLVILKENPLPASVTVRYRDDAWLERSEPGEALRGIPEIQEVRWDPEARTAFRSLHQWRLGLRRLLWGAAALMILWALSGLFRFIRKGFPIQSLSFLGIVGAAGGALAMLFWAFSVKRLGIDASLYSGSPWSPYPVVVGMLVSVAGFGLESDSQ